MDHRKLQTLLAVLRTGSFSRAAAELNCSQSAVTQMMNALESELGCKLVSRSHNGAHLTPAGEALLPLIVEADACLTHLSEQAQAIVQGSKVPIRIGSFSSLSNAWLPTSIRDYQKEHPAVTFDIRIGTDVIPRWLKSGEIDIALADAQRCKGFRWFPLMDDFYYAILPQGMVDENTQAIHQNELNRYPFIIASSDSVNNKLDPFPSKYISVNCDDGTTLMSMVDQGLGVTVMSRLSLTNAPASIRILELQPPVKRVLGIALSDSPSKAAKDFAAFLRKRFPY